MRKIILRMTLLTLFLGIGFYSDSSATAPSFATPTNEPTKQVSAEVQQVPQQESSPTVSVSQNNLGSKPQSVTARQATVQKLPGNTLSIQSLNFQAPIIEVGLTTTNAIDVPAGLQVGHWNGSAYPGQSGAIFLDGHVDGVFRELKKISIGQILSVVYNDVEYKYRVVTTETVPLDGIDMNRALSPVSGATEGLNIMTCAGRYIPSRGTYDQRFVVYAIRSESGV